MDTILQKKRELSPEICRIIFMIGIIAIHAIRKKHFLFFSADCFCWCTIGFALISGYFGVQYRLSKIIRLYSLVIIAVLTSYGMAYLVAPQLLSTRFSISKQIFVAYKSYWYVNSYCVLLLISPMLNYFLEYADAGKRVKIMIPLFLLCLIWNWLICLPGGGLLPSVSGFGCFSPLVLIAPYICGRVLFFYRNSLDKIPRKLLLTILVFSFLLFSFCRLWHNASPFTLFFSIVFFLLINRIPINKHFASLILLMSPSMFSIYLLHMHTLGMRFMDNVYAHFINYGAVLAICMCIALTFLVSLVLDVPRRILAYIFQQHLKKVYNKIDDLYDKYCLSYFQRITTIGG